MKSKIKATNRGYICGCKGSAYTGSGSGCGNPDCIKAPKLNYGIGYKCGEAFSFNIFEESNITLAEDQEVVLKSTDPKFFVGVTLDSVGNLSGSMANRYQEGSGNIMVRVCQVDGPLSATGCISIPFENLCAEPPCTGTCDPCTGKWICVTGSEVDGTEGQAPTAVDTNIENPFYHNVVITDNQEGDISPLQDRSGLRDIDPTLMDSHSVVSIENSNLIKPGAYFNDEGVFIFEQACGVGQVTVNFEVCDPLDPSIKDQGVVIINIDNPPSDCHECDENGNEVPLPESVSGVMYDDAYITDVELNDDGTVKSFTTKCSEDLPTVVAVTYTKHSCGGQTQETVDIQVDCPSNCLPCQEEVMPPTNCEATGGGLYNPGGCDMCNGSCNGSCNGEPKACDPKPEPPCTDPKPEEPPCPVDECTSDVWTPLPEEKCEGEKYWQTNECGESRPAVGTLVDDNWYPSVEDKCEGHKFIQRNDCGKKREAIGTAPTEWFPDPSTKCVGENFIQYNECGDKRPALGTMEETWSPDPEDYCEGEDFTQESCCGNTRPAVGTKVEEWGPLPEDVKEGKEYIMRSNCGGEKKEVGTCPVATPCDENVWTPLPETQCKGKTFRQTNECGGTRFEEGTYEPECPDLDMYPEGENVRNECGELCGTGTGVNCPVIPEDCSVSNDTNDSGVCVGSVDKVNLLDNVINGNSATFGTPHTLNNIALTDIVDNGDGTYDVTPSNVGDWCFYVDVVDGDTECGTIKVTGKGNDCSEPCSIDNLAATDPICDLGKLTFNVTWSGTSTSGNYEGSIVEVDNGSWFDITNAQNWVVMAPTAAGDTYTIKVRDKDDPTCEAEITVTAILCEEVHQNTTPGIIDGEQILNQESQMGDIVSVDVSSKFEDTDGDLLTYTASGLPTGLVLDTQTGIISGEPTEAGTYTVTLTASDGSETSPECVFEWLISESLKDLCEDGCVPEEDGLYLGQIRPVQSINPPSGATIVTFLKSGDRGWPTGDINVDWGDGTTGVYQSIQGATPLVTPNKTYAQDGVYIITTSYVTDDGYPISTQARAVIENNEIKEYIVSATFYNRFDNITIGVTTNCPEVCITSTHFILGTVPGPTLDSITSEVIFNGVEVVQVRLVEVNETQFKWDYCATDLKEGIYPIEYRIYIDGVLTLVSTSWFEIKCN